MKTVVPLTVHVVAHTHWDREWYHTAGRFQARLVALVDALLAAPPDAATPFLLDGQTIVLADYLAVRPERLTDVTRALASGALETGPWYVLADNLIPSGEAIVRNLEAGKRWLGRMGALAPRTAYCPDTFGHPAAIPLLARGFGCDVAIVWRGFGGRSFPNADTVWWDGPDGSRVLLHHLPPDGYEFGNRLPTIPADVVARWRVVASTLRARNHTGTVLLASGADHHAAAPDLTMAIEQMDTVARDDHARVERSGLSRAGGALLQAALRCDTPVQSLPRVIGELRDSYGYTWALQGALATRAHQKRTNARLERALLRDVEPWTALAWLHAPPGARSIAANGSLTLAQLPVLMQRAWETLLQTHPHDTLCGCSIDHVAADMSMRQRSVAALVVELRDAALACALAHDRVVARGRVVNAAPLTVLRNRSARARGGIAELRLVETLGDVPVGPGSTNAPSTIDPAAANRPSFGTYPMQPVAERVTHARRESPQHYPDNDLVRVHHVVAWVPEVPAFGVRVFGTSDGEPWSMPSSVTVRETSHGVELENGTLRVIASSHGVVIVHGKRRLENALRLETVVDAGDSYTPSLRGVPEPLQLRTVRVGARGPLRASIRLEWAWRSGRERVRVSTEIILDAGTTHVRCDVRGWNARRNHRLQLVWNTDVPVPHVTADAAFGPVTRTPLSAVPGAIPFEIPPLTMPLHRWLSVHDAARGVTLISDGLAEGQPGEGRLALTLVRAIGELSRNDLAERPGHAGWPSPIPAAQCHGRFAARVGLLLHGPFNDDTLRTIEESADHLLMPLTGESWRDLEGASRALGGPELHGEGMVATAVHLSDSGNALVLRAANVSSLATIGRWTLPSLSNWRWRRCRLDGEPLGQWTSSANTLEFAAGAREVVTVQVERE